MKKLILIPLLLILTTSSYAQYFQPNSPLVFSKSEFSQSAISRKITTERKLFDPLDIDELRVNVRKNNNQTDNQLAALKNKMTNIYLDKQELLKLVDIEKMEELKKKIKSALVYPAMIVTVAVGVTIILMVFVVPVFEKLFSGIGSTLPMPTRVVIAVSNIFKSYLPIVIAIVVVLAIVLRRYYKTENGKRWVDDMMLKLPIFGELLRKVAIARFARTLGTLVSSGVPILEALNIVAGAAGNKVVEEAILKGRISISEGQTISEPLSQSGVFPVMVTQMIAVGETTGSLELMLNKVADFYESEVDTAVATLSSMLEPVLMIFLGVIVGGLVISMYLPIFKIASVVG